MKKIFFITLFVFLRSTGFSQSDSSIILSEVMFNPVSGNNEFIEIYNSSSTHSVNLSGWKIKYHTSTPDQIIDIGYGTLLPPKSYAIIFENDYIISSGIYANLVPQNALILKISDNAFGTSGMANTTSRPLWLLRSNNDTIDAYIYSANNSIAISDEKRILNRDSSQTNWSNSLVSNGTPGSKNSVSPSNFDLSLISLRFSPEFPIFGDNVIATVKVKNNGILTARNFSIRLYHDLNFDSTSQFSELIFSQDFTSLLSNDSISLSHNILSPPLGTNQIIAEVFFNEDENPANNKIIARFEVSSLAHNFNDIVINEIMYAPTSPQPEWIEIFNRSDSPINLKKWRIFDAISSAQITSQDLILQPDSFLVITADMSILNYFQIPSRIIRVSLPSLSNNGDAVVIKDSLGILIDSLYYLPSWGGDAGGYSLERISIDSLSISPTNWKTSLSPFKATPGLINSVTKKNYDVIASDILFNPKYPFINDTVSISALIKNIGRNIAIVSVELFEDTDLDSIADISIETINNININFNDSAIVMFNYKIRNLVAEKGFYIRVNYLEDQDTSNNYFYKRIQPGFKTNSIVINEIMFAPSGGEPEWIELFNQTSSQINLKGWRISDIITTPKSTEIKTNFIILPNSYAVITKDTSIINYHSNIPSPILQLRFAALNNDIDGVILKDNRGLTIDSVFYSNQWGGTNGHSLERISSTEPSNLSSNWSSSIDSEQSTPGRINSITPKRNDLMLADLIFNPRFPVLGENISIAAKVKNIATTASSAFEVKFFIDSDSNNIVDLLVGTTSGNNIQPNDSLLVLCSNCINNLNKKVLVAAKIFYPGDEDSINNFIAKFVEPGFATGTIKITEIMFNPDDNKPEWIEFINNISDSINLRNWSISDILTTPTKGIITNENIFIKPNEYFIVTKDTSFNRYYPEVKSKIFYTNFGTLGNTSDGIIIYDFRNGIIDSLFYRSSWGNQKGVSLERISFSKPTNDSLNWTLSLSNNGSTPGAQNSINYSASYKRNSIIINEIMYEPDDDNTEFIEFYNASDDSINIGGWFIQEQGKKIFRLTNRNLNLPSKSFFLLAADSNIIHKYKLAETKNIFITGTSDLSLSNSGELLLLKDVTGNVIDSVFYSPKWHNNNFTDTKNRSLERINPFIDSNEKLNWSSSVNQIGATPLQPNSILTLNTNTKSIISVEPNPFSPDNDGYQDYCIINYNLTQAVAQVRIKIFDSKGRLLRTLLNNQPSGQSGSVIFDGLDDQGRSLRIGIYIVFLEALNDNSGIVDVIKTVLVIARKL